MEDKARILCVDDEKNVLKSLERLFLDEDYDIFTAGSVEDGLKILEEVSPIHIVISDYRMPGTNGVDFLKQVCRRWPDTVRIVLSGYADMVAVISAINDGQIYKFIPKPWNDEELKIAISNAIERFSLYQNNVRLTTELRERFKELERVNEELGKLLSEHGIWDGPKVQLVDSSERLQTMLPLVVLGMDKDGPVVLINGSWGQPEGPEGREFVETNISSLIGSMPEEAAGFIEKLLEMKLHVKLSVKDKQVRAAFAHMYRLKEGKGLLVRFGEEPEAMSGVFKAVS